MAEFSIRERCEKRLAGLKALRKPYEEEWKEISRHAQPARSRFLNGDTNKRRRNTGIYDGHGIRSFRTLTGGMTSGLSSSSRPWFKLSCDADLMESQAVKEWLTETEKRIYAFIAATNFYGAAKSGYSELGMFGVEAGVITETPAALLANGGPPAIVHALTAGEYWLAVNEALLPDTLYRRVPMTTVQAMEMFGDRCSQIVKDNYKDSKYEQQVDVWHAIEPNRGFKPGNIGIRGMPWRSIWWDEAETDNKHLLRESGYHEQPFWACRWDSTGSDVWGSSPGMQALPDMRELQMQSKRKAEATDYCLYPEIVTTPQIKLKRVPKAVTSVANFDQNQVMVPHKVEYQAIQIIAEDVARCREAIDSATYADLFMAITNMEGIQPRNVEEIAARNEEKMTQLGSVVDNVNNEKLEVVLDRIYGIMLRGGLFPEPPEELAGREVNYEFVSILAQVQRMVGIGQIERTASFVGNLMGTFPEARDKLNVDEMVDEYSERAGTPAKLIRSDEEVKKIRDGRAQQAQMEQMAAMAQPMQQGADAARLLSEAALNGAQLPQAPL